MWVLPQKWKRLVKEIADPLHLAWNIPGFYPKNFDLIFEVPINDPFVTLLYLSDCFIKN